MAIYYRKIKGIPLFLQEVNRGQQNYYYPALSVLLTLYIEKFNLSGRAMSF